MHVVRQPVSLDTQVGESGDALLGDLEELVRERAPPATRSIAGRWTGQWRGTLK